MRSTQTKSYTEQHPIFDGEAMLYRTTASGEFWQFRTWIASERKYVRKSLKTRDRESAVERGKKLYLELQHAVQSGKKIFGLTARELVDQFLNYQEGRVEADRITKGRFLTIKTQLNRHFIGFLGKGDQKKGETVRTGELDRKTFYDFAQYRRKHNPDVRDVTLRNEQTTFNALFTWAERQGLTPFSRVDFEEIRIRNVDRRDTFTFDEFRALYRAIRDYEWPVTLTPKTVERRKFIRDFIGIKIDTVMRFGELRNLKWGDIQRVIKRNKMLLVDIVVRKEIAKNRKERRILARGGEFFENIKTYSRHTGKADFVFCDNETGKPIGKKVYYEIWRDIMTLSNLDYNHSGKRLTYYSLRHFGITVRLYAGVSYEDLSAMAGTSFAFLQNHYSHVEPNRLMTAAMKGFSVDRDGLIIKGE
jgi:integrase